MKKLFLILGLAFLGSVQFATAQVVDSKNKVEYSSSSDDLDDMNSISAIKRETAIAKKIKARANQAKLRKRKKSAVDNISVDDLSKIANLRFRKKRDENKSGKCFKKSLKKCNSVNKKKKVLEKSLQKK